MKLATHEHAQTSPEGPADAEDSWVAPVAVRQQDCWRSRDDAETSPIKWRWEEAVEMSPIRFRDNVVDISKSKKEKMSQVQFQSVKQK